MMPEMVVPGRYAADILNLDSIRFIEPSYADLIDRQFTEMLGSLEADQGRLLVDEESDPIALAVHTPEGWIAGSFYLRKPTASLIEYFEQLGGDIYQEEKNTWVTAVREYYSLIIACTVSPSIEDLNPARSGMIDSLIGEVWGDLTGVPCLDCCCGSGVGSAVLRKRGFSPISYDIDQSLLALGLATGRLLPRETMCFDASIASRYLRQREYGIGLMFGEFNAYNQDLWKQITIELISLAKKAIITVGTEAEARLVEEWGVSRHNNVEVRENARDPIYDRWVCIVEDER